MHGFYHGHSFFLKCHWRASNWNFICTCKRSTVSLCRWTQKSRILKSTEFIFLVLDNVSPESVWTYFGWDVVVKIARYVCKREKPMIHIWKVKWTLARYFAQSGRRGLFLHRVEKYAVNSWYDLIRGNMYLDLYVNDKLQNIFLFRMGTDSEITSW